MNFPTEGKLKLDLDHQEFAQNMTQLEETFHANKGVGLAKLKLEKAKFFLLQAQSPECFHQAKSLLEEAAANQQAYESENQNLDLEIKLEVVSLLVNSLGNLADAEPLVEAIKSHHSMMGADAITQVMVLQRLAKVQTQLGNTEEGLATLKEALRLAQDELGRNSGCAIACMHDLGR